MTPKEKAKELFDKYYIICQEYTEEILCSIQAKQSTLIAVDEIMESEPIYPSDVDWDDCGGTHQYYYEEKREEALNYWQEVKQEIEKL